MLQTIGSVLLLKKLNKITITGNKFIILFFLMCLITLDISSIYHQESDHDEAAPSATLLGSLTS